MGRSSKEQADANRRQIVLAAGNLFRSRGYDAVGIADVMKAAGMTQGGFYKHFASKEALAAEAWKQGFEGAGAIWQRKEKNSPAADIIDYYLAPKPPEYRCPMVAHGEEVARWTKNAACAAFMSMVRGCSTTPSWTPPKGRSQKMGQAAVCGDGWGQFTEPGRRRRRLGRCLEGDRQGSRRRMTRAKASATRRRRRSSTSPNRSASPCTTTSSSAEADTRA